jgi:S-adenosylmethionine:diacylglycerol 3-amino-3-carboxypropyl transferase
MIYKFKSKATGDLIMLGPNGDQMLRLLGREPAAKGIVDVDQLAAAIAALRAAVRDAEAQAEQAKQAGDEDAPARDAVSLRQRLWPVIDMFERSLQGGQPVVWGV